jgi:hypothetical protein
MGFFLAKGRADVIMAASEKLFGGDRPNGIQSEVLLNYNVRSGKVRAVCGVKSWAVLEGEASCVKS